MTWIKLHGPNGGEIWVCAEQIRYVLKSLDDKNMTDINFDGQSYLEVKEPLEEVMDRLRRLSAS